MTDGTDETPAVSRDSEDLFARVFRKNGPLLAATTITLSAVGSTVAWMGRRSHRFVHDFEPWGIVLTFLGVAMALVTILVELEDRQVERTFRAWQVVLVERSIASSQRQALEYLNRTFDGAVCVRPITWLSIWLTGNRHRECLFPPKARQSFRGIDLRGAVSAES